MRLNGKTIVLGVCGGIAAYKAAALCSKLTQAGAEVHVIMTKSASQFITPLTLQTISRQPVISDTFDERNPEVVTHIDLADRADMVVIAPATANIIAKMAHGLADDMLSTTLLATTAPVLVAPAMNVHMLQHAAVQHNLELLRKRGVRFVEPGEGQLACGYVGKGRLAEPEQIVERIVRDFQTKQLLVGKKVLVTAGGTIERIDPVRYITNDSSGKMGFALAETARNMGAEVTLVYGKTSLPLPVVHEAVAVASAQNMYDAVMDRLDHADLVIKAAAVADYRPVHQARQKLKKKDDVMTIELEKTKDILQEIGARKESQFVIGFAAETENVAENAKGKLVRKNCDLVVANDVSVEHAGFESDTNIIQIYDRSGLVADLPLMSKADAAERILQLAAERMKQKGESRVCTQE